MAFLLREAAPTASAFIAAGESACGLFQNTNESNKAYWERVGRAAVDAYRSAADPKADAKRILNLLLPFAETIDRNRDFATVARETSHFVRDLSLFSERLSYSSRRERLNGTEPRLRAESSVIREKPMTTEPKLESTSTAVKLEPASRPGIKTATAVAAIALGISIIVYWSQIKAVLNLG
jgi:hypothetical protein